jgi:hypothetical protein
MLVPIVDWLRGVANDLGGQWRPAADAVV